MKSLFLGGALATVVIRSCITPANTTVLVENKTAFPLEVVVLFDDDQNILEAVLEEVGTELNFTLQPDEVYPLTRACDRIQAVRVSGDLQIIGDLGPSRTSRVFRDGSDFGCGSRLTFRFTAPVIPTTLELSTTIED